MAEPKMPTMADARKQASSVLFAIAAIQFVCYGAVIVVVPLAVGVPIPVPDDQLLMAEWLGVAVVFGLLGIWARQTPLPPVAIGLLVYLGLLAATTIANPESIMQGFIVKVVIVVALILAIKTSLSATPDDPADAWAEGESGTEDWDGRSSGKRHDPDKDGYS